MSLTTAAAALTLIASMVPLVLLARRDPKRLRSITAAGATPYKLRTRQVLAVAALIPGVALIGLGYWPAFLIWMGGLIASGWILVQILAARR